MCGAPPACAARPTKRAVLPKRPLFEPGTHVGPSSGRDVVWIIIAMSTSSRWPRRRSSHLPPRNSSRPSLTSLRRHSRSPPSSAGTAMSVRRPARCSKALVVTRPIAAPISPAIWALWPQACAAPVAASASGWPVTTSASSSPSSAKLGPDPRPPATPARTPEPGARRQPQLAELRVDERRGPRLLEPELWVAADGLADLDDLVGVALDRFV